MVTAHSPRGSPRSRRVIAVALQRCLPPTGPFSGCIEGVCMVYLLPRVIYQLGKDPDILVTVNPSVLTIQEVVQ